jgi:hypothetical protein
MRIHFPISVSRCWSEQSISYIKVESDQGISICITVLVGAKIRGYTGETPTKAFTYDLRSRRRHGWSYHELDFYRNDLQPSREFISRYQSRGVGRSKDSRLYRRNSDQGILAIALCVLRCWSEINSEAALTIGNSDQGIPLSYFAIVYTNQTLGWLVIAIARHLRVGFLSCAVLPIARCFLPIHLALHSNNPNRPPRFT